VTADTDRGRSDPTPDDEGYFDEQITDSVPEFWRRMGGMPDVAGLRVLEIGCGHGAMAVVLAQAGALVTGVDLDEARIRYAEARVRRDHPHVAAGVTFLAQGVADLEGEGLFDAVVSKDTFEHVADLDGLVHELRRLVRPGGMLYLGFSPLFHSPYGHHERIGYRLPWVHAVLPRRRVIARAARHQGGPVTSLFDIGLNGFTPADYRRAFPREGLVPVEIHYNAGDKRLLRVLNLLRWVPGMEPYATVSIYAVPGPPGGARSGPRRPRRRMTSRLHRACGRSSRDHRWASPTPSAPNPRGQVRCSPRAASS
jgi:SAM-dependent methyltransferase